MNAAPTVFETDHEPVARADFCDVSVVLPADFTLDSGETLSKPELSLRIYGDLAAPVIAVAGGISSGRAVADASGETGWWRDFVGAARSIDLDRYCVLAFDFLPNPEEIARTFTTVDQARALGYALEILNIEKLHAFVGASYGGMTALAFAAEYPGKLDRLVVISAAEKPHPAATALRGIQRRIIDFGLRAGNAREGVSLARQLAMTTYRTPGEFAERFDGEPSGAAGENYPVCNYLAAKGRSYTMDAQRYLSLSDSIDRHRVDPSTIETPASLIAVDSDGLVPIEDMRRLNARMPSATLTEISSRYGHDAFLKEQNIIGPKIADFLQEN